MLKYIKNMTSVVFEEIPDKITLAVNITNCQNNCKGCHSVFLKNNIGEELNESEIDELMTKNNGVNCFLFLGEGNDKKTLLKLSEYVKTKYHIDTAIYSGRDEIEKDIYDYFDFVKIGSYKKELGGLNKKETNQHLYYHMNDITYKFWNK